MFRDETCLDRFAAMLLGVSIAGAATAGLVLAPGSSEALGGLTGLVLRLRGRSRTDADKVLATLQRELKANWRAWGTHSSHADEGLRESVIASFEEVIPSCAPTPAEVVGKRLDADAIASLVLSKAIKARPDLYTDRSPNDTDAHLARTFLTNVTTQAYARLLAEPGYIDEIAPRLWQDLLDRLERIERGQEQGFRDIASRDAMMLALLERIAGTQEAQAAHRAGISDDRILKLAQRIAADVPDLDRAFAELERAVEIAIEVQTRGTLGSNTGDFVDIVLARMAALSAENRDAEAAAEADRAFAEWEERQRLEIQKGIALLEAGLRADRLRRDPASAARRIAKRLELEVPDPTQLFGALSAEQEDWTNRGRDRGLNLDLKVAIELARLAAGHARDAFERGAALNDLGKALTLLGEREAGTLHLEEAIQAFQAVFGEWTRDRFPFGWASANNDLGGALRSLGVREAGTASLEIAAQAYRDALTVFTREHTPVDWGIVQNNLASVLTSLGERESGTERLREAIAAHRSALEVRTRAERPEDWAYSQNNLGNALKTLFGREQDPALLEEAIECFHAALEVWTRKRVPIQWARAHMNLGNALRMSGRLQEAVDAYGAALEEWTRERAPLDWATAYGNQGVALGSLAAQRSNALTAQRALAQITDAEQVLRDGGHVRNADYFLGYRRKAEALLAQLTRA